MWGNMNLNFRNILNIRWNFNNSKLKYASQLCFCYLSILSFLLFGGCLLSIRVQMFSKQNFPTILDSPVDWHKHKIKLPNNKDEESEIAFGELASVQGWKQGRRKTSSISSHSSLSFQFSQKMPRQAIRMEQLARAKLCRFAFDDIKFLVL